MLLPDQNLSWVGFRRRIAIMVSLQILLIVTSFVFIVHFESQTSLAGNMVNVAGKNRQLTSQVQIEMSHVLFYDHVHDGHVSDTLEALRDNILFLRDGGTVSDIRILPLSPRFEGDWNTMWDTFTIYETVVLDLESGKVDMETGIIKMEEIGSQLLQISDGLTEGLGRDVDIVSSQLVFYQIVIGAGNVVAHLFMIYRIWRMFRIYALHLSKTERFAAIGELASTIAHDLRNPLGIIRNSATIIRDIKKPEVIKRETDRIDRSVSRMSHQIEGVLNYARSPPLVLVPANIRQILDYALESVPIPPEIQVTLPEDDITIMCDVEKLEFVFANLILNAVQAIDCEGHIKIRMTGESDFIRIEFENSGQPLSKGDVEKIFEPLYTTRMKGTGLGLTSCRNIVKRHGGTITVTCNPVTFTILIPRR